MSKSFGNLFSAFKSKSNFTKNSNVTHVEIRNGNAFAIMQNGGTLNIGQNHVREVINGSGASTMVLESGVRMVYDHATGQTRQV